MNRDGSIQQTAPDVLKCSSQPGVTGRNTMAKTGVIRASPTQRQYGGEVPGLYRCSIVAPP